MDDGDSGVHRNQKSYSSAMNICICYSQTLLDSKTSTKEGSTSSLLPSFSSLYIQEKHFFQNSLLPFSFWCKREREILTWRRSSKAEGPPTWHLEEKMRLVHCLRKKRGEKKNSSMGAEQNSISGKLSLFINSYPNLNFLTSPCAMESGDKGRPYV